MSTQHTRARATARRLQDAARRRDAARERGEEDPRVASARTRVVERAATKERVERLTFEIRTAVTRAHALVDKARLDARKAAALDVERVAAAARKLDEATASLRELDGLLKEREEEVAQLLAEAEAKLVEATADAAGGEESPPPLQLVRP